MEVVLTIIGLIVIVSWLLRLDARPLIIVAVLAILLGRGNDAVAVATAAIFATALYWRPISRRLLRR